MGTLTIVIKDDVEKELRRLAAELHGTRKGSLSTCIEESLKHWILETRSKTVQTPKETGYVAKKEGVEVARASTLEELAKALRKMKLNPRTVEIVSIVPLEKTARMGLRAKAK